jgi:hypothetical protein
MRSILPNAMAIILVTYYVYSVFPKTIAVISVPHTTQYLQRSYTGYKRSDHHEYITQFDQRAYVGSSSWTYTLCLVLIFHRLPMLRLSDITSWASPALIPTHHILSWVSLSYSSREISRP